MKGKKSARAQVTQEHYRQLAEWGFVPHRDQHGRLWFTERDEYRRLVEAGAIKPGESVQ